MNVRTDDNLRRDMAVPLVIGVVAGAIFVGIWMNNYWRSESIQRGFAEHNQTTGAWQWKTNGCTHADSAIEWKDGVFYGALAMTRGATNLNDALIIATMLRKEAEATTKRQQERLNKLEDK